MDSEFKTQIHKSRKLLENPYAYVIGDDEYDAIPRNASRVVHKEDLQASKSQRAFLSSKDENNRSASTSKPVGQQSIIDLNSILGMKNKGDRFSEQEIEFTVRELQNQLWLRRSEFFADHSSLVPINILDPLVALASIGYRSEVVESLGEYSAEGERFEVAGIIDRSDKKVLISRQFRPVIRNFTAAHELGHAIFHQGVGLHRDRPLDGTSSRVSRGRTEFEADYFAVCFLMPEKHICIEFARRFKARQFVLREDTAFALSAVDLDQLRTTLRTARDLSRLLADAKHYDGCHFLSLAEQFNVSIEAMAIRLEELKLICQ